MRRKFGKNQMVGSNAFVGECLVYILNFVEDSLGIEREHYGLTKINNYLRFLHYVGIFTIPDMKKFLSDKNERISGV